MSDQAGGRGAPPKWVSEPRQQAPAEDAPGGSGVEESATYGLGREGLGAQTPEGSQPEVDEPGVGPGALLAAERSAQGLGVGDIARQLKLSVRQVEALERDDYDAFAGMVFVRGFLRNYAKLLDLDPDPLVAMTHAASAEPPPMTAVAEEPGPGRAAGPRRGWLLGAVVLIALAVAAIYEGRQREAPPSVLEPAPPAPAPGISQQAESPPRSAREPARPAPVPESPQHAESPPPSEGTPVAADQAAAVVAAPAATSAPAAVAPPPVELAATVSTEAPAPADEKQLKLEFAGASWVEVKDAAGAVIFSQLNDAGTEQVVRGRAPLSVVIGNAHSVRLSYGERPVDLNPHTNVDVARLVLE